MAKGSRRASRQRIGRSRNRASLAANALNNGASEKQGLGVALARNPVGDGLEIIEKPGEGTIQKIHYLTGGDGSLFAMYVIDQNNEGKMYYIYTDHLGSPNLITDAECNVVQELSFDAWGNRRDPATWQPYTSLASIPSSLIDRGFTFHEHLYPFTLINMNGRAYDPLVGRFLSADPYIQAPDNPQNLNRYSYCLNNPLRYSDPSGEFIWFFPTISFGKEGFSFGFSFGVGIPGALSFQAGVSYNFKQNDLSSYVGATYAMNTVYASLSTKTGFSAGYTAGLSMHSGFPISSNLGTIGINYNFEEGNISGNISAWRGDKNGWSFSPSFSAMIYPERFTNLVRSGHFLHNNQMFNYQMSQTDMSCQDILDYWDFKGQYRNEKPNGGEYVMGNDYYGSTNPTTGKISYGDGAFDSYDNLYATAMKEYFNSRSAKKQKVKTSDAVSSMKYYPEEALGFRYAFRNKGLYPKTTVDQLNQANAYWKQVYGINLMKENAWYYFIFKIHRKW